MRVLIIKDERTDHDLIASRLREKSCAVDLTHDCLTALTLTQSISYDIIIFDYSQTDQNCFDICHLLRSENSHVPMIVLSPINTVTHKIDAFSYGIDDYITKPFFFDELFARMNAVLCRPKKRIEQILSLDNLSLDSNKQIVARGQSVIYLTRKEFSLLEFLLRHTGSVVSRSMLIESIWDTTLDPFSNTIETHILNLRKKIDKPFSTKLIHSIPGRGYKIDIIK